MYKWGDGSGLYFVSKFSGTSRQSQERNKQFPTGFEPRTISCTIFVILVIQDVTPCVLADEYKLCAGISILLSSALYK
jgi:hypothetical protein